MNFTPSNRMVTFRDITIVMWTLASLCILLTIGRYVIRYRVSLRFYKDDFAHLFALAWLIIFCSITQAMFAPTHVMLRSVVLETAPPPETISEFCRLQTAQGATFYLLHWTVKLAFLLFYRELFWVSSSFIRAWWCVATFVFLGLGVALAGIMTQRGPINRMDDPTICATHNAYQQQARVYICVANVSTDLAVMLLPLGMLRQLRIRKTQKIGLILVFSVCLLTIALELFRFVRNLTGDETTNNVLYAVINANLTVIISCTPTYRSLWKLWQKSRKRTSSGESSSEGYARPRKSIQKLVYVETNFSWSERITGGPAIPLQDLGQGPSSSTLQPLQPVARPPSYTP
ncbi:hypothetical protein BKA66DRAFT_565563 [Pyrenochaeta sp. MPI-SDFR-AT-0127]|nr:hypothetical protein BKA66DRAFT_565563 [Pyrenochaeta sp. MPI-SDFR-AT-0127]